MVSKGGGAVCFRWLECDGGQEPSLPIWMTKSHHRCGTMSRRLVTVAESPWEVRREDREALGVVTLCEDEQAPCPYEGQDLAEDVLNTEGLASACLVALNTRFLPFSDFVT